MKSYHMEMMWPRKFTLFWYLPLSWCMVCYAIMALWLLIGPLDETIDGFISSSSYSNFNQNWPIILWNRPSSNDFLEMKYPFSFVLISPIFLLRNIYFPKFWTIVCILIAIKLVIVPCCNIVMLFLIAMVHNKRLLLFLLVFGRM